jgi:hypothetical protein
MSNIKYVTALGAIFLVLYIPFMTVQNLMTSILQASGFGSLGFKVLGVLYLF